MTGAARDGGGFFLFFFFFFFFFAAGGGGRAGSAGFSVADMLKDLEFARWWGRGGAGEAENLTRDDDYRFALS